MQNNEVSKLMETTLFSDGLNGPVGMSDAALSLWCAIIEFHSASGQTMAQRTVTRVLTWLSSHYILSVSFQPFFFFSC